MHYYMKIVCYGASVTQQKEGYVYYLKEMLGNEYEVIQCGYGSQHVSDTGVSFSKHISKHDSDIIFIEWFSTGYINSNYDELSILLDAICYENMKHGTVVCMLLLIIKNICPQRILMYENVKKYCLKYNLDYLEMWNVDEPSYYLRDCVHTNANGSTYYANIMSSYVKNIFTRKTYDILPQHNEYFDIETYCVEKKDCVYYNIEGHFKIVSIYQCVGPYSGDLEIIADGIVSKQSTHDQWCNYERMTSKLNHNVWCNKLEIRSLNNTIMKFHIISYIGKITLIENN